MPSKSTLVEFGPLRVVEVTTRKRCYHPELEMEEFKSYTVEIMGMRGRFLSSRVLLASGQREPCEKFFNRLREQFYEAMRGEALHEHNS